MPWRGYAFELKDMLRSSEYARVLELVQRARIELVSGKFDHFLESIR